MSSTLRVTNVIDTTGGTSTNLMSGLAKAWSNLNGTGTIAERDSFNISGYVDNGTGDYSINFSSPLDSGNYQLNSMASQSSATSTLTTVSINSTTIPTASVLRVFTNYVTASNNRTQWDEPYTNVSCNGDLA